MQPSNSPIIRPINTCKSLTYVGEAVCLTKGMPAKRIFFGLE